ncbi:MAG: ATP-binding cassette domain-containing protein [bacterium]|nr:ATP-binding cassette domain-containing protein [bacterium]
MSAQAEAGAAPTEGSAHVAFDSIDLSYGTRDVFRALRCEMVERKVTVLMGPSGSGKSTLLRMIGGLQRPDAGSICVAGRELQQLDESGLATVRQRLGMLFQNGALLDSMTIFDNVALPLREHTQLAEAEIAAAVRERLDAVGLEEGVETLLPGELSGGMLRRAALARAIIEDPEILLCDEPFSGLDPPNVERIEALLMRLNRERGLTVIVTSHHMASSLRMGHRLVLLKDKGAVSGTPRELAMSQDSQIHDFLGADGVAYLKTLVAAEA